jgi:hypothetical protein
MAFAMGAALIGGAVGLYGANQQKKAANAANAANMAGFNQYKPYVDANLANSEGALGGVLNTGAYQGQTYAAPNQFQTGTANTMGGYGTNMMNSGNAMMGSAGGFGNNANSLYGQYQGMSEAAQQDRLGNAMDYASANAGGLVDSAMRDDRRNLQENTLTGIDMAASGSGNMNSSRAGIAEAVANRGYDDRRADVAMGIQNNLIDRSLNQQQRQFQDQGSALQGAGQANQSIMGAYNTGMNTLGEGANFGMNAGNSLQQFGQAGLDDQRRRFEQQRDFELQQRKDYQAGILGKAPDTSNRFEANSNSPAAGAIGGAMQGFGFASNYGQGPSKQLPMYNYNRGFNAGPTANPHTR